ncbi:hypothetical protein L249_5964, partial [Ophiocordyceps polyrhachis-furcata BCC 54312]
PPQRPESQWGYSGYSARSTRYSDRYSDRRAHPINLGTRQPLQRSARCTYSGHSARSVVTAVITLQLHYFFNTITSPAFNSSLILTKPPSRYEPGFSHLIRDTNKLSTNFLPPSSSSTAPQNTLFDSTFPTLGLEQT